VPRVGGPRPAAPPSWRSSATRRPGHGTLSGTSGRPAGGENMAQAPYLMGIDLGTGGVRVGLFDREGSPAVFHAVEFATDHPRPGWAEQDPGEWGSCLPRASRGALEESGVPAAEVAGISVDATTVEAVDADGRHLRPAI